MNSNTNSQCIGGTNLGEDIRKLDYGQHIVSGTPGCVFDMIKRRVLRTRSIKMLVLDEADEMLNKGFKEQIYDVYRYLPPATQVCLISATLPHEILEMTSKFMTDPIRILVKRDELTLEGIKQNDGTKSMENKFIAPLRLRGGVDPDSSGQHFSDVSSDENDLAQLTPNEAKDELDDFINYMFCPKMVRLDIRDNRFFVKAREAIQRLYPLLLQNMPPVDPNDDVISICRTVIQRCKQLDKLLHIAIYVYGGKEFEPETRMKMLSIRHHILNLKAELIRYIKHKKKPLNLLRFSLKNRFEKLILRKSSNTKNFLHFPEYEMHDDNDSNAN